MRPAPRPHNLGALTPPWLDFRIVSASDPEIREGTRIRDRLRLYGVPVQRQLSDIDCRAAAIGRMLEGR